MEVKAYIEGVDIMEKFNITNSTKRQVAKEIKKEIGNNDYTELAVMYTTSNFSDNGYFHIAKTSEIQNLEEKGECYYKTFEYYKTDGKITLEEIETKIFE